MFDTFDKKVINLVKDGDFKNDIFANEEFGLIRLHY